MSANDNDPHPSEDAISLLMKRTGLTFPDAVLLLNDLYDYMKPAPPLASAPIPGQVVLMPVSWTLADGWEWAEPAPDYPPPLNGVLLRAARYVGAPAPQS